MVIEIIHQNFHLLEYDRNNYLSEICDSMVLRVIGSNPKGLLVLRVTCSKGHWS